MRTLTLAALFTFALGAHAAPAQPSEAKRVEARKHLDRAQMYYKLGEYQKAHEEFSLTFQLVPKPTLLFNLGQSARLMGDGARARDYYKRFLAEEQKIEPAVRTEVEGYIAQLDRETGDSHRGQSSGTVAAKVEPPAPPPPPPAPPPAPEPAKTRTITARAAPTVPRAPAPQAIAPVKPEAGSRGSTSQPAHEPVRPPPTAPRPFYKTWWFWTAVGVVAASGTAAVIVAASPDEEPIPPTRLGTVRF